MSKINLVIDENKQKIKEIYQQALVDLDTIQNTNLNTIVKLEMAVKKEAEILKTTLKYLRSTII